LLKIEKRFATICQHESLFGLAGIDLEIVVKMWPGKTEQWDEWIFCLTATMAVA
jgi:hypothetical protein